MILRSLLALSILSSPLLAQRADTTATKAALIAADRELAKAATRDGAEAFLRALTPDAAVLFPGQSILEGASAANDAFLARYGSPSSYSWNPVHALASADGKFGCTFGYSRFQNAADTAKAEHRGDYLTCWKKGSDGKWRVAGTQRNDSPPQGPVLADSATLSGAPHSA
ncbi:MAG TPA: nuclear transport factor 2 family protein, partial [Gemmatimonadaceae bacterium]|nr:nuclear transport factor 2 family protein [Gemmatimonadaceae bacterium]